MNIFITTSKTIAASSFIIGTILFALQLFFRHSYMLVYPRIIFIIVAVILNTIALLGLLIYLVAKPIEKHEIIKTCGMVLLNIPIAIAYFIILIHIEFPSEF